MYEMLKKLMTVAEQIGAPSKVITHDNEEYYDDSVIISGVTNSGHAFELALTITNGGSNA